MLWGSLGGRGVWGRMATFICMIESLCCPLETTTTLLIGYTPILNSKLGKIKRAPSPSRQTLGVLDVMPEEAHSISFVRFQPRVYNPNLIVRRHQTHPKQATFCKTLCLLPDFNVTNVKKGRGLFQVRGE